MDVIGASNSPQDSTSVWLVYVPRQAGDERVYARLASAYASLAVQGSQGSNPVYIDALSKTLSAVGHPLTPAC